MKFCIIGDSWGTNHPKQFNYGCLSNELIARGHDVLNISAGGGSNFGQLQNLVCQVLEKNNVDFDYIIWMLGEPSRDFTEFISLDFGNDELAGKSQFPEMTFNDLYKDLKYIEYRNYLFAQEIYDKFKIPFIIIGCSGSITNFSENFNFAKWRLKSWNQEICGLTEMPVNCYRTHIKLMIEYGKYDEIVATEELTRQSILYELMRTTGNKNYPDGFHPSTELYIELVGRILNAIK